MHIEDVKKILDSFYSRVKGPLSLNILGGEPTQYSKFKEALVLIVSDEYNKYVKNNLLISNFLFNKDILDSIIAIDSKTRLSFLVNGMELDEYNRINLFKHNLEAIGKTHMGAAVTNKALSITIAITLADNRSVEYHKQYISFLEEQGVFELVARIRIGIDLSNSDIINNKKYGVIIKKYYDAGRRYNIPSVFDCQVPPCVFEDIVIDEFFDITKDSFLNNLVAYTNVHKNFTCTAPAFDVLPDLKAEFCYQTIGKVEPMLNIFEHSRLMDAKNEFMNKYKAVHKPPTNEECLSCRYYPNVCSGLCLGCAKG